VSKTTAEDFLDEPDASPVAVEVNGKKIKIQILTAVERDYVYETEILVDRKARFLEVGVLNEKGEPLFSVQQTKQLMEKRTNAIEKMVSLVIKHNQANDNAEPLGNES